VLLNVSRGKRLDFAANGKPVSGIITGSHNQHPPKFASVGVETEDKIRNGARLTIPDCPEAGDCGAAIPTSNQERVGVILRIPLSCVDVATIGE